MDLAMDPAQWAKQLADNSVYRMQSRLDAQKKSVQDQQNALNTLKSTLSGFRSSLSKLNTSQGIIKNSATANHDGFVNLKASAAASKGLYQFSVNETAAAEQISYAGLTDQDIKNATGKLTLGVQDKTLDIALDGIGSLADLRDAINKDSDNPGVIASLMKVNGKVELLLSSEETGLSNKFSVSATDASLNSGLNSGISISRARDAVIRIGGDGSAGSGREVTSSSNSFKDLIPGVEINILQKTEDRPLIINVETDAEGSEKQLQEFVDAYNSLKTELDKLTKSGGEKEGRGPLAGDAGVRVLEQQLNNELRRSFGGFKLSDYGIEADKKGQLVLHKDKMEKGLRANPLALNSLFSGKTGLVKTLDKSLDSLLNVTSGSIKTRNDALDRQNKTLSQKTEQISTRYDNAYNRYLREFTRVQAAMQQMQQTMSQFF
ncbi:flagellar hook-associated protein 2 [Izhakiella capsodis]|uniref:Flagellar hook-associated protein 2 n=2 Tax=cellular organisms TaxID=131567 RepID=A0A1I5B0C0_9GAMM|nr:flagellar filament capping protein FliD [Izhakiella capsodis]SFN68137.1 flagellar hook-associated protein 2 [Izhakiella capsodis]